MANIIPISWQDIGALWENFLMSERKKFLHYAGISVNSYFWRTKQQQEIDYVEERGGKFYAYEFKWNPNVKPKFSKTFINSYQPDLQIVNKNNFEDFVMK